MLALKTKGLFIEFNQFSTLAAVTSGLTPPFKIERLKEFPAGDSNEDLEAFLEGLLTSKSVRYVPAVCGIYPKSRFFRRHTLESPAKAKEDNFFTELLTNQFRIDPTKNMAAVLNAIDGAEFNIEKPLTPQKNIVIAGAQTEELLAEQERLTQMHIYPERLELGSVATIGALVQYARFRKERMPTLVLEITPDSSHLFILSSQMVEICRPIPYGLNTMFPLIQEELGLKDEDSARKLLFSNTFDFTEMGPILLRRMLKELQASTGFYEVQTGQTISNVFMSLLPRNLRWIGDVISRSLGVEVLEVKYSEWLASMRISVDDSINVESLDGRWHGLLSLMGDFNLQDQDGAKKE